MQPLFERTTPGLHDRLVTLLPPVAPPANRALDLGAGTGAFARRLAMLGWRVEAADADADVFAASIRFHRVDLDGAATGLPSGPFDLVTAIEVIEHLESPIGFLRHVHRLLATEGTALITTPNVESLAARLKFVVTGKIRTMDERGDPTHISPIHLDLLPRYLERAGLVLQDHRVYPARGYAQQPRFGLLVTAVALALRDPSLHGDVHVLRIRKARAR